MAVNKSSTEADTEKWDDYLEVLIDTFKPFLLETLRVSHLLCLIDIQEVKDKAGVIHKKENAGDFTGASKILLDAIKSSDQPGKWQMFIDALIQKEDTAILQTLLSERSHTDEWLSNQANRNLIQIFSENIERSLHLDSLLNKMWEQSLIFDSDVEELRSLIHAGKRRQANAVLLLQMHRHSDDWYNIFMGILCDDDYHFGLANRIDPEFCSKRKENAAKSKDGASQSLNPSRPQQSTAQGMSEASSKGQMEQTPSLGGNLGGQASAKEKIIGDKSLQSLGRDHGKGDEQLPGVLEAKVTCECQCCAQMLTKVTSLESELAEMKALLRDLVNSKKL